MKTNDEKLAYLLYRLTQRELAEKLGLDQWKFLVKMKDDSFTDKQKQIIEELYNNFKTK